MHILTMQDEQTRVDGRLPIPSKVMSIMRGELAAMSFEAIVYSYQAPVPASGDPQGFAFRIRTPPIMEIPPVKKSPPVTESPSVTRSILAMERIPVTAKFYLGKAV